MAGFDVVAQPEQVRRRIALTGQFAAVDETLTGRENLVWFGRLKGLAKDRAHDVAKRLLVAFDLADAAHQRAGTYSGGMRRRLDVAVSLVVEPEVLVLDEPTTGLDPRSRRELWAMVRELRDRGVSVLLTTQYLEEADELADRIVVVDRGRVVAEGSARQLKDHVGGSGLDVVVADPADLALVADLATRVGSTTAAVDPEAGRVSVPVDDGVAALAALAEGLRAAGVAVDDLSLRRPSLDEVFLALTGHPAEPATGPDGTPAAATAPEGPQ